MVEPSMQVSTGEEAKQEEVKGEGHSYRNTDLIPFQVTEDPEDV